MAYEFKKLSDVESVDVLGESASILIEENGVIKKAPNSIVGGAPSGGATEADLVIEINNSTGGATVDNISILSGNTESVYAKFENGEIPVVEVWVKYSNSYMGYTNKILAQTTYYGDSIFADFISFDYPSVRSCKVVIADNAISHYSAQEIAMVQS